MKLTRMGVGHSLTILCLTIFFADAGLAQGDNNVYDIPKSGVAIEVDDIGNKYILIGSNQDSVFGGGELLFTNNDTCSYGRCNYIYMIKLSPENEIMSKMTFRGDIRRISIVISEFFLYIAGAFTSDTLFMPGVNFILKGIDNVENFFVVKYDLDGNLLKSKHFAATTWFKSEGSVVIALNGEEVVMAGTYLGTLSLDAFTIPFVNGSVHDLNSFVARLDNDLNVQWLHRIGGEHWDAMRDVVTDNSGNIYVTGSFASSALLIDSVDTGLGSQGYWNDETYILKFNRQGTLVWQKQLTTPYPDYPNRLAIGRDNSIYLTGNYQGEQLNFGDTIIDNPMMSRSGFLAKFTELGDLIWVRQLEADQFTVFTDVALDKGGNIWITGHFLSEDQLLIGDYTFEEFVGGYEIFVARYSPNGDVMHAEIFGGSGTEFGRYIRCLGKDKVVVSISTASAIIRIYDDTIYNPDEKHMPILFEISDPISSIAPKEIDDCVITLAPNPVSSGSAIHVYDRNCDLNHDVQIRVVSYTGVEVYQDKSTSRIDEINTILLSGLYFVEIRRGSNVIMKKLVVK